MNAGFDWWLLIVGLVVGGGLVWFVLLDIRRDEDAVGAAERRVEAGWIADILTEEGRPVSAAVAERVLELHAAYLATTGPRAPEDRDGPGPGAMPHPGLARTPGSDENADPASGSSA
ncbi:MAG: hypothetical protein ACLGIJ_08195 [Candidatus Limnocylindria bacterium]